MKSFRLVIACLAVGALAFGAAACGDDDEGGGSGGSGGEKVSGPIAIDGSSTVFPFAQAAAQQFQSQNPDIKAAVAQSGTGGGFEKFCRGETDISDASRPIEEDEIAECEKNGIKYAEIQVANDGIAIATNKDMTIECMTTDQLKQLWSTDEVKNYNQIDPKFPDQQVSLFGPGTDSGTFDFFTDVINGEEGLTRKDYQPSEDDNVLVQGVSGDAGGLGYFGFSYYEQNQDKLNLVAVDGGGGCIKPSADTIQSGEYKPLSRPLFMYVSDKSIAKPQVKAFMDYTLENEPAIAEAAQIVPMTEPQLTEAQANLAKVEGEAGGGTDTGTETQ